MVAPYIIPYKRNKEYTRAFRLYIKSYIGSLFKRFTPNLDPKNYLAAA